MNDISNKQEQKKSKHAKKASMEGQDSKFMGNLLDDDDEALKEQMMKKQKKRGPKIDENV